jgi:hypothetical protein
MMSLDVYLYGTEFVEDCSHYEFYCPDCDQPHTHHHARAIRPRLYEANITHNLGLMAKEAGVYDLVWRPEEHGVTKAGQLIDVLRTGIPLIKKYPKRFEKLNASNGLGMYHHFVPFLDKYLEACEKWPDADVEVSR